MTINVSLGEEVARLRKMRGLSQEELASRAGVHRTYISQIERGLKSPTLNVLFQLARQLGTSASNILLQIESVDEISTQ
jgi:transcriptional regulator with XRE-family HTH domain